MNEEKKSKGLTGELERLVKASEAGDFGVVLDQGRLSREEAEAVRLINKAIGNYRAAMEYDLMKYRLTSDALGIALWDMDVVSGDPVNPSNKFTWSREFRHMLGFSDEMDFPDILSSWSDLLHPEDKERTLNALAAHLNDYTGITPYDVEYRLRLKNGSYHNFHAFGTSLRDGAGAPLRVAGALEDVNEKKQMAESLKQREKMLSALNEMAVMFLSHENETFDEVMSNGLRPVADAAGVDRIAVYRLLDGGSKLGQIYLWYGQTVPLDKELLVLPDNPPVIRWMKFLIQGGCINANASEMAEDEAAFLSLFGVKSIFFVPIFIRGEFWGVITLEDHTNYRYFDEDDLDLMRSAAHLCAGAVVRAEMEREVAVANLRLKDAFEQATAASKAKSEFLANMSHEIRTPMNAVLGLLQLARSDDLPPMAPAQADYVLKAEQSAKTLLRIINDILDFSKIEAGRLDMEKVEFPISQVLSQMTDMFGLMFREKGLVFEISAPPGLPPSLMGDPLRLAQVLFNLIGNAIKFTEKGGVSLSVSEVGRRDLKVTLQFTVRDTGIGMTQDQIEGLFDHFSQADTSTTRKYGGTGLGLAISQKLAHLMRGEIRCASEPGRGATFHLTAEFELPAEETRAFSARPDRKEEKDEPLDPAKPVLLTEDNELNQIIARKLLEKNGLKVDVANNGREAINMLLAGDYGLVLMDIQMPVMDGLSAAMEIRKMERFKDLPIIAMTAHAMSGDREKSLEAGMNDHLTKPIDVKMLYAVLKKWLRAEN